jgi:hypothetical protein
MRQETKRQRQKKEEKEDEKRSVQIASMKLTIALEKRSTIYVYLNPDNNFFLCPVSFLLPCAPPMPNKSAHIYKDFFFFFSPFFFYIADYFFFLSLSPFRYSSSTKANNRKNEREKPRDDEFANTSHHTTHIQKSYSSLSFFF